MGVFLRMVFFSIVSCVIFRVATAQKEDNICGVKGCTCTTKAAPWITVNCTFGKLQEIELEPDFVPDHAVEIFINGGRKLVLGPKSFYRLAGLNLLRIVGTANLVAAKESFADLTSPSLLIQIQNCDRLDIKTAAFDNVQSSIETEIIKCTSVSVEKQAFSKLSNALFVDIPHLVLKEGTFQFKNQAIIGRHGPVTTINFERVVVSELPYHTFYSSLAEINFRNSEIREIHNEAFYANQISGVTLTNCRIITFQSGAFTQKTLIYNFKVSNCTIARMETRAIMAAITNLTVQFSNITDINTGAINSTVAKIEIVSNEIANFRTSSFVFQNWDHINVEQNLINHLHPHFLSIPSSSSAAFTFKGNYVFNIKPGALSFVRDLEDNVFHYDDNFLNHTCYCFFDQWIQELLETNASSKIETILDGTFCEVNELLAGCFKINKGYISVRNFSRLVCNDDNTIVCEPYQGEVKIVNNTSDLFIENSEPTTASWLYVVIAATSLLIFAAIITFTVMLIRGGRWLKRKNYFRKIQYNNQNEHSNDEENTIETVDESDKFDFADDLTLEILQRLNEQLDDPDTHQEAREKIEQLYQRYVRNADENNDNNNLEEENLYEELGNLAAAAPPPPEDVRNHQNQGDSRSILKIMEEKFNLNFGEESEERRPALVGEYSEPSDACSNVHLYSELKQNNKEDCNNSDNSKDSMKSRASSKMAFRPLPDKPGCSKD